MSTKTAFLKGTCSLTLLVCAAMPCVAQQVKSSGGTNAGKSNPVSPNPAPSTQPVNPSAPSAYRGFGLSNPAFRGTGYGYGLNGFAANQAATSSIIASLTNSPFVNQMQQGYLPGSNIPNPWALPNPYMSPFMNPLLMSYSMVYNPYMNPLVNNPFLNPMMNSPFLNPMMSSPFMNPMMAGNPFLNPMMTNPMMNPMMMNGGYVSPFMMQPGMFGTPFGQPGLVGGGF